MRKKFRPAKTIFDPLELRNYLHSSSYSTNIKKIGTEMLKLHIWRQKCCQKTSLCVPPKTNSASEFWEYRKRAALLLCQTVGSHSRLRDYEPALGLGSRSFLQKLDGAEEWYRSEAVCDAVFLILVSPSGITESSLGSVHSS